MVNWKDVRTNNIEYAERAFNHGIKKEEYEELFLHPPFAIKKFIKKGEVRYRIIGKAHGKYILIIATWNKDKLRIFSGREASEKYKDMYKKEYQR